MSVALKIRIPHEYPSRERTPRVLPTTLSEKVETKMAEIAYFHAQYRRTQYELWDCVVCGCSEEFSALGEKICGCDSCKRGCEPTRERRLRGAMRSPELEDALELLLIIL